MKLFIGYSDIRKKCNIINAKEKKNKALNFLLKVFIFIGKKIEKELSMKENEWVQIKSI